MDRDRDDPLRPAQRHAGRTTATRRSWRFWLVALVYEAAVVALVWYGVTHQS
jgi:hypothetical protein